MAELTTPETPETREMRAAYEKWLESEKQAGITWPPSSWASFTDGWNARMQLEAIERTANG